MRPMQVSLSWRKCAMLTWSRYDRVERINNKSVRREIVDEEREETGFPSLARDHAEPSLNLHTYAVRHPASTFFLRAEGEGLQSVGIFPGDILVVDRMVTPQSGDVVIAIVDGAFLTRRWERDAGGVRLCTDSEETQAAEVSIWGVVAFVVHAPGNRRRG